MRALTEPTEDSLSTSKILKLYLPLALSWTFMALEGPMCVRIITTLAEPGVRDVAFAALNALMAYSLFIESPVIDLLATSTTLAKSEQLQKRLSTFALYVIGVSTFFHMLVSLPPVFDLVTSKLSPEVTQTLYWPFVIMIPWSGFIGWRRFRQGLLIRSGNTKAIGLGTMIRFSTLILSVLGFGLAGLDAVVVTALALVASVATECLFVHFVSSRYIRSQVHPDSPEGEKALGLRAIAKFHMPLTATTMLNIGALPIITNALATQLNPIQQMAAWQISMSVVWVYRTLVYALPEVVIALYNGPQSEAILKKFCLRVGLTLSGIMLISSMLSLDKVIFIYAFKAEPQLAEIASLCFKVQFALPFLAAIQSYIRGMLTAWHFTTSRLYAVLVGFVSLLLMLFVGPLFGWQGVVVAGVALTVSILAELGALGVAFRRAKLSLP